MRLSQAYSGHETVPMRPNHPPDLQRFDILRWPLDGGAVCRGAPGASQPDLHIAQSDHRTSPVLAAGCHVSRKRSISGRYLSKYRRTTAAAASETRGRSSAPGAKEIPTLHRTPLREFGCSGLGDPSVTRFLLENSRSTEDRRKEELLESFGGNRPAFGLGVKDGALQGRI